MLTQMSILSLFFSARQQADMHAAKVTKISFKLQKKYHTPNTQATSFYVPFYEPLTHNNATIDTTRHRARKTQQKNTGQPTKGRPASEL